MAKKNKDGDEKRFVVRMPTWFYGVIETLAQEDMRSVNAEIIMLLTATIQKRGAETMRIPEANVMTFLKEQYEAKQRRERAKHRILDPPDDDLPF